MTDDGRFTSLDILLLATAAMAIAFGLAALKLAGLI